MISSWLASNVCLISCSLVSLGFPSFFMTGTSPCSIGVINQVELSGTSNQHFFQRLENEKLLKQIQKLKLYHIQNHKNPPLDY